MDINPLFKLFTQFSDYSKRMQPDIEVYLSITTRRSGFVTIIHNGEKITPFSWENEREGLHRLRTEIAIVKNKV